MILIAGPSCGGKSTYVQQHANPTDVVLDFDDIVEQLTGTRYTRTPHILKQAQAEWTRRLPLSDWVIWTAPRRTQRGRFRSQWNANIIVVKASLDTCLTRAAQHRPLEWQTLIRHWFRDWEPSKSGREQIINTDGPNH